MISITGHYLPTECHITPSAIVIACMCSNPECKAIHAWQFIVHWGWWAVMLTWEPGK